MLAGVSVCARAFVRCSPLCLQEVHRKERTGVSGVCVCVCVCVRVYAGRDVSNGTYRVDAVRQAFQRAARRLEALAQGRKPNDMTVNYLQVR